MLTLANTVNDLGVRIHQQTMAFDTNIVERAQGLINIQPYLNDVERSLLGEYYADNPQKASSLLKQLPQAVRFSLMWHKKKLLEDNAATVEEFQNMQVGAEDARDLEDLSMAIDFA